MGKATKLVHALRNLSYCVRKTTLEIPTLSHSRANSDMIEAYKMNCGFYDSRLCNIFTMLAEEKKEHLPVTDTEKCT